MATETNNDLAIIKSAIEMALQFPPFVEPCQCDGVANQVGFWRDGICGKHQLENALRAIVRLEAAQHSMKSDVSYRLPDSIQEALNSGDGVYRP